MTIPPMMAGSGTTNLILNPSAQTDLANITPQASGTIARITTDGVVLGTSVETTASATFAGVRMRFAWPGAGPLTVSFSAKLMSGATDWRVYAEYTRADNSFINTQAVNTAMTLTTAWSGNRVAYTWTPAPTETPDHAWIQLVRGSNTAGTARFADVQVDPGSTPSAFTRVSIPGFHSIGDTHIGPMRVGRN